MKNFLVSINDLPPDGKDFDIKDQEVWEEPIKEYKMDCRIVSPIEMKLHLQPADEGVLIRGQICGQVAVPCNRCAERADIAINGKIDEYEEIPKEGKPGKKEEYPGLIVWENHAPMINIADIAWEQFMLCQPINPLCKPDCKGICPQCGANRNINECDCEKEKRDPRMAKLADLKISK